MLLQGRIASKGNRDFQIPFWSSISISVKRWETWSHSENHWFLQQKSLTESSGPISYFEKKETESQGGWILTKAVQQQEQKMYTTHFWFIINFSQEYELQIEVKNYIPVLVIIVTEAYFIFIGG